MKKNSGQVILIILLVTAVGLTIGLSLVSRTINDVKISSQVAESSKAFSAAEAGIETALRNADFGTGNLTVSGSDVNYIVSKLGGDEATFVLNNVAIGNSQTFWLVDHEDDGTISPNPVKAYDGSLVQLCWGPLSGVPPIVPAMEVTMLFKSGSTYKIGKVAYDPNAGRTGQNNFKLADSAGGYCDGRTYRAQINFAADFGTINSDVPIYLRLMPVYANTDIALTPEGGIGGGHPFAVQGKQIVSTGKTSNGVARRLNVLQGYTALPPVFDFTLFTTQ